MQTLCPINRHLTAQLRAEESTPWMRRTLAADNPASRFSEYILCTCPRVRFSSFVLPMAGIR